MPAQRHVVIIRDYLIGTRRQCRCERLRDFALERIAGEVSHLGLDGLKALTFALPNLDREQLEQMAVAVCRSGAGTLGSIEQTAGDIEANGAGTGARLC